VNGPASDLEGTGNLGDDPTGQGGGIAAGVHVPLEHRELVATDPGNRVRGPDALSQPGGHGTQKDISGVLAKALVHRLKTVQVEEMQGEALSRPRGQGHRHLRGEPVLAGLSRRRLLGHLLRQSRYAEVFALWGRTWAWQAGLALVLMAVVQGMLWAGVTAAWPYVGVGVVGLAALGLPVWQFRLRRGLPFTRVERQLAQMWAMSGMVFLLTGVINHQLGLPVLRLLPVVVLECGLAFGCMAAVLGGSYYGTALVVAALSLAVAAWPGVGPLAFGVAFAAGLLGPGWQYVRGPAAASADVTGKPESIRGNP
jgi:hypothetical protein